MANVSLEIIDVVFPDGAISLALRQVCANGKVRVFVGISEITEVGMLLANNKIPPTLQEVFEHNG